MHILIVDDSALYRKILSEAATAHPGVEVTAVANGDLAMAKLSASKVDLVLLDVFMPDQNGPEVLNRIKAAYPAIPVVMVSGATGRDAQITLNALSSGAMDFIAKPTGTSFEAGIVTLRSEIRRIVDMARLRSTISIKPDATISKSPSPTVPPKRLTPPPFIDLLLIGVSTGGPKALAELLPRLPAGFPVPVVIVQHMPPVFTLSLSEQLNRLSPLSVIEAPAKHKLKAGEVLIAPGGMHLEIVKNPDGSLETRHSEAPPVHSCRPSVDVLFESAARCGLRGVVAVVLTGMGSDGAQGVAKLKAAFPTWCIAQNSETCAVYGMPQAVVNLNLDDELLPLGDIAPRLNKIFRV